VREWSGDSSVLDKLPSQLFPVESVSILEWDYAGMFNGKQPQFHKVMAKTVPL